MYIHICIIYNLYSINILFLNITYSVKKMLLLCTYMYVLRADHLALIIQLVISSLWIQNILTPKALGTFRKSEQKECKSQRIREFSLRLCLLVMSEAIVMTHQHECPKSKCELNKNETWGTCQNGWGEPHKATTLATDFLNVVIYLSNSFLSTLNSVLTETSLL